MQFDERLAYIVTSKNDDPRIAAGQNPIGPDTRLPCIFSRFSLRGPNMIQSISLKFTESADPLVINTEGITIFVGPNNSGKSLLLRELEAAFSSNGTLPTKLLQDYELSWPTEDQMKQDINALRTKAPFTTVLENVYVGRFRPDGSLEATEIHEQLLMQNFGIKNKKWVASQFLRFFQIRLDGRTRFDLTNDRPTGDLLQRPTNTLAHLFQNDELRNEVRRVIYDAFGVHFVIDPLLGGQLRIRLSARLPSHDEQSLGVEARALHREATHIKEASDGVQAFVGIVTAVLSGDYRSILIDEPEAFLHPPLARKLGYQLAATAAKRSGTLMASTHSPDFLMGCLQASNNVRVVRLEYSNGKSRGQVVDPNALRRFFKAPLIRSANVISGLFHDGVVVTESDNDRAFYSEIYHRLAESTLGYPSLLFVNAQNKQTIRDIIEPLRAFGVPAAAIVDIDILKDGGATWTGWLRSAHIPEAARNGLSVMRGDIAKLFSDQQIDMKNRGGVNALSGSDRDAAHELFDKLDQYGVFTVRSGELESWLLNLKVPGKKSDWTVEMLDRLGDDPSAASYVRPDDSDVWEFISKIVAWIKNPQRHGVASGQQDQSRAETVERRMKEA